MTGEFLVLDAIVEIPRGSRNKYEFDPGSASIRLDRVLYSSVHYPGDYGFVVGTRCGDDDPLDVLIVVEEPTVSGCRVRVRPIGVLLMEDEGAADEKLLAVAQGDPRFAEVYDRVGLIGHARRRTTSVVDWSLPRRGWGPRGFQDRFTLSERSAP